MIKITRDEFIGLDDEDKWKNYINMKQGHNMLQISNNALNAKLRNMQLHLKHIARKIMFLLEHPNTRNFQDIQKRKYDLKEEVKTNDKEN